MIENSRSPHNTHGTKPFDKMFEIKMIITLTSFKRTAVDTFTFYFSVSFTIFKILISVLPHYCCMTSFNPVEKLIREGLGRLVIIVISHMEIRVMKTYGETYIRLDEHDNEN